jgi:hypothetical protein
MLSGLIDMHMRQTKLKNFNGNVSMGYYANRINWRRNFHNNLHFFLLKSKILYIIERQKLTIIRNIINGRFT